MRPSCYLRVAFVCEVFVKYDFYAVYMMASWGRHEAVLPTWHDSQNSCVLPIASVYVSGHIV